jgi:hypothetical protein
MIAVPAADGTTLMPRANKPDIDAGLPVMPTTEGFEVVTATEIGDACGPGDTKFCRGGGLPELRGVRLPGFKSERPTSRTFGSVTGMGKELAITRPVG